MASGYDLQDTLDAAQLWPFAISWGEPYTISYGFLTQLYASRTGREARVARRERPRISGEFAMYAHGDGLLRLQNLLWKRQAAPWVFPDPTRVTELVSVDGSDLVVADAPDWLVADQVLVVGVESAREFVRVSSVNGTTVTLMSPPTETHPAGAVVAAGWVGFAPEALQTSRVTRTQQSLLLDFRVEPLSEPARDWPEPFPIFAGREAVSLRVNWAEEPREAQDRVVFSIDNDYGPLARFVPRPYATQERQFSLLFENRDEAERLLGLFHRMRGRQGEFYMPTWDMPMTLAQPVSVDDTELWVNGTEAAEFYADSTVHQAVAVVLHDGTVHRRRLRAKFISGDSSVLQVEPAWDVAIASSEVHEIQWLLLWRFVSDDLVLEWWTDRIATAQITLQTLEGLPPDPLAVEFTAPAEAASFTGIINMGPNEATLTAAAAPAGFTGSIEVVA